ncbi:multicopper oxidase [Colletotrichum asianum]
MAYQALPSGPPSPETTIPIDSHLKGSIEATSTMGTLAPPSLMGPIWIVPAAWRPRPYHLISDNEHDIRAMRAAESNPQHVIVSDWNDQPMDMYLSRFRDTGYIPICANSLTLNGRVARDASLLVISKMLADLDAMSGAVAI